jgi:hypothetical protein
MSSSDSDSDKKVKTKTTKKGKSDKQDYQIKPSTGGASLDTSKWPLLLKVMIYFTLIILISEL